MAYRLSKARREFQSHIQDIQRVLRVVDIGILVPEIRSYTVAAAILLGHARFENFIVELIDLSAIAFCALPHKASKLPAELRVFVFLHSLNLPQALANYSASKDESKLINVVKAGLANPQKALFFDSEIVPPIKGSDILRNKQYPSEKNLERVFCRMGVPMLFDKLSAQLKTDSKLLLKGLSDKRTELAHNAVITGTSARDVKYELEKLTALVAAIDRITYGHIAKHVGNAMWQSHVS